MFTKFGSWAKVPVYQSLLIGLKKLLIELCLMIKKNTSQNFDWCFKNCKQRTAFVLMKEKYLFCFFRSNCFPVFGRLLMQLFIKLSLVINQTPFCNKGIISPYSGRAETYKETESCNKLKFYYPYIFTTC